VRKKIWFAPSIPPAPSVVLARRAFLEPSDTPHGRAKPMKVQPYLSFDAKEAIEFYKTTIGADAVMLMRSSESSDPLPPSASSENKILHASPRIGETEVMASNGHCGGAPALRGIALSLAMLSESEANHVFNALAEGGEVPMPIGQSAEDMIARRQA
jgi:PhnB protein